MYQGYPYYPDEVEPGYGEYYPDADGALVNPGKLESVANWPKQPLDIGQVAGVAVDGSSRPVVFHRADRVWESRYVIPMYFVYFSSTHTCQSVPAAFCTIGHRSSFNASVGNS